MGLPARDRPGLLRFAAAFGGLALLITPRLYKLIALVVMAIIVGIAFVWVSRRSPVVEGKGLS